MNKTEIIEALQELSKNQGFYCRLLISLQESTKEDREEFFSDLEDQNINCVIDLIMYLEE